MQIRIPTPEDAFLHFYVDVVPPNVPLLLGIDVLDRFQLVAENVRNVLENRKQGWTLPIQRKHGHLYLSWDASEVLFTASELKKLHGHFYHPSSSKLYALLRKTHPDETTGETLKTLQEIQKACRTCSIYSKGPHRFRVTMPNEMVIFNHELAMDLIWLKSKPVLHVVDTHTHFSAAMFIPSKRLIDIWHTFLCILSTTYIGHPDRIRVDQEIAFTSREFNELARKNGIEIQLSGIQSHNAIGPGERYHQPLRRIFNCIVEDAPNIDHHLSLQLAVKSMNDTMGPDGNVPSIFVFGVLPRFPPIIPPNLPGHKDCMRAMAIARQEMANITAKLKMQLAVRSLVPPAASYTVKPGCKVLVYDEKTKLWKGPFEVTKTFQKCIWIMRDDGKKQYSIDHCLPVSEASSIGIVNYLSIALS